MLLGLAAKIEVVKVKIESFVELDAMLPKGRTFRREENAIQQFARLAGGAEAMYTAGKLLPMPDDTAEIGWIIPGELVVDECPCWLLGNASFVSRDAQNIELLKPPIDLVEPEKVDEKDVIVQENENVVCR